MQLVKKISVLLLVSSVSSFMAWQYFGIFQIITITCIFILFNLLKGKNWLLQIIFPFLLFLTFNISTCFWLIHTSFIEAFLAWLGTSSLMAIPFILAQKTQIRVNSVFFPFLIFWLVFEWFHSYWDLAFPWLTFGNALGNQVYLIQWYSSTGVLGGSVWLLALGYLLYLTTFKRKYHVRFISLLFVPIFFSLYIYFQDNLEVNQQCASVTIVNPNNIGKSSNDRIRILKELLSDNSHEIIITPELYINNASYREVNSGVINRTLKQIHVENKNSTIFLGVGMELGNRKSFNGIIASKKDTFLIDSKQKYVPAREYMPSLLKNFHEGAYEKVKGDRSRIISETHILPVLCYESVFSSFVARLGKNSRAIFVMASESFLGESKSGRKQYLNIVRIRAIENNRYILKCSDGGISCLIDNKGKVIEYFDKKVNRTNLPYMEPSTIYQNILQLF